MKTIFEKEKLRELLTLFCDFTEITITLFDADMNVILDINAGEWKKYCLAIGDNVNRLKLCKECDAKHAKEAAKRKVTDIYQCHAGIGEAVVPIEHDNTPIAYLMIGKFRDVDQHYSSPQSVIEKAEFFGLDKDEMLSRWEELPLLDSKKLNNAIELLQIITTKIIYDKLIHTAKTSWSDRVTKYIQDHISENITIEDLCSVTRQKRHEFYATFKQYFDVSPHAYMDQLRLEKAIELLTNTQKTVHRIGEKLGFYKKDAFAKFFKERMGVTPTQFRKQKRLQPD